VFRFFNAGLCLDRNKHELDVFESGICEGCDYYHRSTYNACGYGCISDDKTADYADGMSDFLRKPETGLR